MQETYSIAFQWSRTVRWLYTTGRWLIIRSAVLRLQADRGLKPKSKAVITWKAFPCRQLPAAGLYRARIMNNWGQIIMQIIIQIITWKAFPYKQVLDAGLQRAQQMDDNHIFHLLPCCQDCSEVRFKSKEPRRIIIWSRLQTARQLFFCELADLITCFGAGCPSATSLSLRDIWLHSHRKPGRSGKDIKITSLWSTDIKNSSLHQPGPA